MVKDFICIVCPKGCHIHVDGDNITGNNCPRGKAYVIQELTNPTRMITSAFKVSNRDSLVCPCKTSSAISKELMFKVMEEINKLRVDAPISYHQVLIKNIFDTGIDIIATKEIK